MVANTPHSTRKGRVLVAGATGYIGGRLVPRLLECGYPVQVLVRSARKLSGRPWATHPDLQVVEADLADAGTLASAGRGCDFGFFLVHSMNPETTDFASRDRTIAENFRSMAERQSLQRIIYLSGLGDEDRALSHHLASRHEVGRVLGNGSVPLTTLRAAMIIGSGSASFEILRYLVERLPVMITPRWVSTPVQPIGVRNVIDYLIGCLEHPETAGHSYDIGCREAVTYRQLMSIYAEEAGLPRRLIVPVPVLTPRLSSYWIHLVTPAPAAIARPLAVGLSVPVVCRDQRIRDIIPVELLDCREAIRRALANCRSETVESAWTDAGSLPPTEWAFPGDPEWTGGTVYEDCRQREIAASAAAVWKVITTLGGKNGWFAANRLWQLRGLIDRLLGGAGLHRGRRHSTQLKSGDVLDFWRVIEADAPFRLLLGAEMKLPGQAVLVFQIEALAEQNCRLTLCARFRPSGLSGILYWHAVRPFHAVVFNGMLNAIAARANGSEMA